MPIKSPAANLPGVVMTGPNLKLPAGDFCIFFDAMFQTNETTSTQNGRVLFSLSAQSNTAYLDANSLTFGVTDVSVVTGGLNMGDMIHVHAQDSSGVRVGNIAGSNAYGIAGTGFQLLAGNAAQIDGASRTYWLEMRSGRFSVWRCGVGGHPVCISRSRRFLLWKGFSTAVQLTFFSMFRTTQATNGDSKHLPNAELGRWGLINRALSLKEKVAFANGADPVATFAMTTQAGDVYWPLADTAALADSATIADSVQGLLLTAVQTTWQTPATVTPTALGAIARVYCPENGFVYDCDYSTSTTITVFGSYSNPVASSVYDVQLRALDFTTSAVIVDWQTVVTNVSGTTSGVQVQPTGEWRGVFTGLPWGVAWYKWEIRFLVNGTGATSTVMPKMFGVGIVATANGQSIMKQGLAITSINGFTGANQAYHRVYYPSPGSSTDGDQNQAQGYIGSPVGTGAGHEMWGDQMSVLGNCNVLTSIPAKSGASIGTFTRYDDFYENLDWMIFTANLLQAGAILWNQGNSTSPASAPDYYDDLAELYRKLMVGIDHPFRFYVLPVGNEFNTNASGVQLTNYRRAQNRWVRDMRAKGYQVYLVGAIEDIDLIDTTHPRGTTAGVGRIAARMAQTIVSTYKPGINSGVGPTIIGADWDGANTIKLHIQHNGGTALKTVDYIDNINTTTYPGGVGPINSGSAITGFEVSTDTARVSGGVNNGQLANRVTISGAAITGANEITLTLATVPTKLPYIVYLEGKPGWLATAAPDAVAVGVYDNRTSLVSPTLGYPLQPTSEPMRTVPVIMPVIAGVLLPQFGAPVPIVGGWGLHPSGVLVTPMH